MRAPEAVLFDLDGTLIDSTEAIVGCFFHACDALGLARPPRAAVVNSIGRPLEDQFALLTPEASPEECAAVYRERYARVACGQTDLLPGARESLARLDAAGLGLGFATSKRRVFAEMILAHLGVLDYFRARIGPEDVTRPKPDPEAVSRAAAILETPPEAVYFVGDTHYDIEAGHAAGVRCLAVTTGYASRAELEALGPEAVYDSLDEAAAHILRAMGARAHSG